MLQHDLGAVHVGLDRVDGLFDDQLHAHGGGEVEHHVAAVDHLGEQRLVRDRVDDVRESLLALQVNDVFDRTGRQIVEHQHVMFELQQPFCQMGTDESGAAGDQRLHRVTGDSAVVRIRAGAPDKTLSCAGVLSQRCGWLPPERMLDSRRVREEVANVDGLLSGGHSTKR